MAELQARGARPGRTLILGGGRMLVRGAYPGCTLTLDGGLIGG